MKHAHTIQAFFGTPCTTCLSAIHSADEALQCPPSTALTHKRVRALVWKKFGIESIYRHCPWKKNLNIQALPEKSNLLKLALLQLFRSPRMFFCLNQMRFVFWDLHPHGIMHIGQGLGFNIPYFIDNTSSISGILSMYDGITKRCRHFELLVVATGIPWRHRCCSCSNTVSTDEHRYSRTLDLSNPWKAPKCTSWITCLERNGQVC